MVSVNHVYYKKRHSFSNILSVKFVQLGNQLFLIDKMNSMSLNG